MLELKGLKTEACRAQSTMVGLLWRLDGWGTGEVWDGCNVCVVEGNALSWRMIAISDITHYHQRLLLEVVILCACVRRAHLYCSLNDDTLMKMSRWHSGVGGGWGCCR